MIMFKLKDILISRDNLKKSKDNNYEGISDLEKI